MTDGATLTVGRDASGNDIALPSSVVSRRHAVFHQSGGVTTVEDLNSRNGTKVNDVFVSRRRLSEGDRVRIGPYELYLRDGRIEVGRPSSTPLLRAVDLTREGSGDFSLAPTSLQVSGGELVGLIGPSGCGKSTLVKLLAGAWKATSGEVTLLGEPRDTRLWDIGYVPQDDILHRFLTVEESVMFAARLRLPGDLTAAERQRIVQRTLRRVGLSHKATNRVDRISGGQRKRLALATELVSEPLLMLLDEPTSGLDPDADKQIMRLLREMAHGDRAVVAVTHSTRWLSLCDRLLVLNAHGSVAYEGPYGDALRAFDVSDPDDMFEQLRGPSAPGRRRPFVSMPRPAPQTTGPPVPVRSRVHETLTLAHRTALSMWRDRLNLAVLAIMPPAIGGVIALTFGDGTFGVRGEVTKSAQMLFALTMTVVMLATNGGVRALLRERSAVERELAAGVGASSHVGAKTLVLGTIAAMQAVALAAVAFWLVHLHAHSGTYVIVIGLLAASAVAALTLGLLLSGLARTEAQAVTMLNFALIPQLLFAGAIVALRDMGPLRKAASLLSARWTYAGIGTSIDLNTRAAHDAGFQHFYGTSFFAVGPVETAVLLMLIAVACIALTCAALRRAR